MDIGPSSKGSYSQRKVAEMSERANLFGQKQTPVETLDAMSPKKPQAAEAQTAGNVTKMQKMGVNPGGSYSENQTPIPRAEVGDSESHALAMQLGTPVVDVLHEVVKEASWPEKLRILHQVYQHLAQELIEIPENNVRLIPTMDLETGSCLPAREVSVIQACPAVTYGQQRYVFGMLKGR